MHHDIATLSGPAARLYCALLVHRWLLSSGTVDDFMEAMGTRRWETFSKARSELEREGFISVKRRPGRPARIALLDCIEENIPDLPEDAPIQAHVTKAFFLRAKERGRV